MYAVNTPDNCALLDRRGMLTSAARKLDIGRLRVFLWDSSVGLVVISVHLA